MCPLGAFPLFERDLHEESGRHPRLLKVVPLSCRQTPSVIATPLRSLHIIGQVTPIRVCPGPARRSTPGPYRPIGNALRQVAGILSAATASASSSARVSGGFVPCSTKQRTHSSRLRSHEPSVLCSAGRRVACEPTVLTERPAATGCNPQNRACPTAADDRGTVR